MRINTNLSALNAYRNLSMTDSRLSKSLERLSSGLRINRAADDAAGLAISEKMRGQIRGLNQAMRNAMDGISLMQTAEGALNESHAILQRMRELSVQASSDTLTSSDRIEIQREIEQLIGEMDRISSSTEFNTKKLLDGSSAALTSTSELNTKIFMRGGLRVVDQFGQKAVGGGNYQLDISATPGLGEVQKTDIMKIKHDVGNSVESSNVGQAIFSETLAGGVAGAAIEIAITVGEVTGDVTVGFDTDAAGTVTAIAAAINSDSTLSGIVTASADGDDLYIVANEAGQDLQVVWDGGVGTGTDITLGAATGDETIDPAEQTITQIGSIDANNFLEGDYAVYMQSHTANGDAAVVGDSSVYSQSGEDLIGTDFAVNDNTVDYSQSVSMRVSSVDLTNETVTFEYSYHSMGPDGAVTSGTGAVTLDADGATADDATIGNVLYDVTLEAAENFTVGDRIVFNNVGASDGDADATVDFVRDGIDETDAFARFAVYESTVQGSELTFQFFQLNETDGTFVDSSVTMTFADTLDNTLYADGTDYFAVAGFEVVEGGTIGDVASSPTAINDIDRFWDANGNFLVQDPKTINLVQGDGKKTSITIFGSDTIQDIENKLNNAIHEGLDQKNFNSGDSSYVRYVAQGTEAETGHFTVVGTFVIQSAVTGKDGEIRFSGDEGVINALSLTTLQKSKENEFLVNVADAHTGASIAKDTRIVGNLLVGVVHENVDVKFNPMAGVFVEMGTDGKTFNWDSNAGDSIFIHLSDNTMVFHIGANPLQDVGAAIGDMSAEALGVNNILVTNRESANRAISQLDYAIGRVSSERAKMGAMQNRLEHTINNLGVAAENLSAAESRVRDLDFALEMVEFTRNQIMMQAGTSMLAQANMKPQSVLMLLQ